MMTHVSRTLYSPKECLLTIPEARVDSANTQRVSCTASPQTRGVVVVIPVAVVVFRIPFLTTSSMPQGEASEHYRACVCDPSTASTRSPMLATCSST